MDQIDRIARALQFIEENMTNDITVVDISNHVGCSQFWFNRVFTAIIGESPGKYIRKRRLNKAAEDLVNTNYRIIDIAMNYSFSSHESFTRSFWRHFLISPKVYRKSKIIALRKVPITELFLRRERRHTRGIMQTEIVQSRGIRIVELPECKMVSSNNYDLNEFDKWWSTVDKNRTDKFFPRDFMYYDTNRKQLVWLYAHPNIQEYNEKYEVVDFKGGLYAALISKMVMILMENVYTFRLPNG